MIKRNITCNYLKENRLAKDKVTANTTIYAKWVAIPAKPSNVKLTKSGKDAVKST